MVRRFARAVTSSVVVGFWIAPFAVAQTTLTCPSAEDAREQFKSGQMSTYPNYQEGGGARVQKQHPDTHIFGQAKAIAPPGKAKVGFCQYSNHVGLVVSFATFVEGTTQPLDGCLDAACRVGPWWRTEYIESDPVDPGLMQVCVVDRDGLSFPSLGCSFVLKAGQ